MSQFATEEYGNPSSSHHYGQQAAKAIKEARAYFADIYKVSPDQIIFTGSGSEADNLAIYGVAMDALIKQKANPGSPPPRILTTAIEHAAVRKTVQSLAPFGIEVHFVPVDENAQVNRDRFLELLTPNTVLVSIQQVNNIVGSQLPVEDLAKLAKQKVPTLIFHTDAVQAFCKVKQPTASSEIDLVSVSAHKIQGPKGVGALIVLNKKLLKQGIRPLIWGGEQEGGFRSGTQSPGLISGFHIAAKSCLEKIEATRNQISSLRDRFRTLLTEKSLLSGPKSKVRWNSPSDAVPHIVSLSVPGYPSGPLAKLLEERGCLVSTGSACSSHKMEPDPVLSSMGLPPEISQSAIRISFSSENTPQDVDTLAQAIDESIRLMTDLLGGRGR